MTRARRRWQRPRKRVKMERSFFDNIYVPHTHLGLIWQLFGIRFYETAECKMKEATLARPV